MLIPISDPVTSTYIFGALLIIAVLFSLKKRDGAELFPIQLSQELKGFAMLAIILSHIGYFLVTDHAFLFPFSILAGVGVDLFLILSGFGLTVSALRKTVPTGAFYIRHLPKLFIPLWIVLAVFFLLDTYLLQNGYSWHYILQSFLGYFPSADVFGDVNSPLWYFTFILFFYIAFPLLFLKKHPLVSAFLMYALTQAVLFLNIPFIQDVEHLYLVHAIAFPLGMGLGALYSNYPKERERAETVLQHLSLPVRIAFMVPIVGVFSYFAYYSGIGTPYQEYISLLLAGLACAFFILKRFNIALFYLIGIYSYELYLIHWPLMSRYDVLYEYAPAWLATALYIPLLLGLGWLLNTSAAFVLKKVSGG